MSKLSFQNKKNCSFLLILLFSVFCLFVLLCFIFQVTSSLASLFQLLK